MKRNRLHKVILIALACMLFAGCSSRPAQESEQRSSLKVMFHDEGYFFQQYGDLFAMKHPNIDIEVVSTNSIYRDGVTDYEKAFADFVDKEQPDVVMLSTDNYEKFASEGKLMELDTLIGRDKYDTETIYPALIEMLKEKGGGKLYGLAPNFSGNAIFYNADLFAKYGVELPHDGMTWEEIFDTARRFPTEGDEDKRVYGFGNQFGGMSLDNLASSIANTQGLQYLNTDTMKITLNTDSWKQAYKLAMDALESEAIYNPDGDGFQGGTMEEYYQSQLFLMGRIAMTIDSTYILQNLKEAQSAIKDYKPFQLGIAAGPVDPAEPDVSRDIWFSDIFSIRANSPNVDAAWEFIKFINGEEFAKVKSRTLNNGLLSRMNASKEYNGVSLDVFYKLKPKLNNDSINDYQKIPEDFYEQYRPILDRELKLAQEKKKSMDEALQTIQDEAQAVLDKAVKDKALKDEAAKQGAGGQAESETGDAAGEAGSTDAAADLSGDSGE